MNFKFREFSRKEWGGLDLIGFMKTVNGFTKNSLMKNMIVTTQNTLKNSEMKP